MFIIVCVLMQLSLAPSPALAQVTGTGTGMGADLVQLVQVSRSPALLPALAPDATLAAEAQRWAETMARTRTLQHSPQLERLLELGFDRAGENVGYSTQSLNAVVRGFDLSASHRRNMMDPQWTSMGVGVVEQGDELFVVVLFGTRGDPRTARRNRSGQSRVVAVTA